MRILQPPEWEKPRGYTNGIAVSGQLIFVAGQIGWNAEQIFEAKDFVGQTKQILLNICAVLAEADAKPEHITRMTWYVVDKQEYISSYKAIGGIYREIIGNHYPTMTAIQVAGLLEDDARLEIEATAVIP